MFQDIFKCFINKFRAETKLEKIAIQAASNKDFEDEVSDYEMTADKESSDEEESDGSNISEEHAKPAIKRDKICKLV